MSAIVERTTIAKITEGLARKRAFKLLPFQHELFRAIEINPRVAVVASRQIGKSEALLQFALAWAQTYDDQLILIVSAGERQASEILKRLKAAIYLQDYSTALSTESATEIKLTGTRSRILSLPNSPKTVRGYPANLLLVDETDSIDDWEDFLAALWPSVSRTNGKIVCSGTYRGKRQLFNLTQDPEWQTLVFPWTVNPPADIEQQRHDLPASRFAEEFECIPVDASSTLFPLEIIDACIDKSLQPTGSAGYPGAIYFAGYDPAKLADPSIVQLLELLPGDYRLRLRQTIDLGGMDYSVQAEEIKGLHQKCHLMRISVDMTGTGGGAYELVQHRLGSRVEGITFTRLTKERLINNLRIAFQDKLILIPDDKILRRELHDLDPQTLDHKSGGTSDRCWALALAWDAYTMSSDQLRIGTAAMCEIIDGQLSITVAGKQKQVINIDDLRDIGFISINQQYSTIVRLWLDKNGGCHIIETLRRQSHPQALIEECHRMHDKRQFEVLGIERKCLDAYRNDFNAIDELHIDDAQPLPIWPIDLDIDRPTRHAATLQSKIATHKVSFASQVMRNSPIWSQIINLQSIDDDSRDAIAGAVTLAQQSL